MVYGTFEFHRHVTINNAPKLLELNREVEVMQYDKNSSTMQELMRSQVRKASIASEIFYEEYQDSIMFRVARLCFQALHERRYYEVVDIEPVDGRTVAEDTSYFTRRPMGPSYGKDMRVYFQDGWIQHCTAEGELLSPYDGIEKLLREKSLQEREVEERQRIMDWTCYGGKVVLDQNLQ
jgi:hypothetical protein